MTDRQLNTCEGEVDDRIDQIYFEGFMNELVKKLAPLEKEISEERGDFSLFALFLREDAPDRWDVVVSAPWFGDDKKSTLQYIARKLRSRLRPQELLRISRIAIVESTEESLRAIHRAVQVDHGMFEVKDCVFFGLRIKHGFIITSKRAASVYSNVS